LVRNICYRCEWFGLRSISCGVHTFQQVLVQFFFIFHKKHTFIWDSFKTNVLYGIKQMLRDYNNIYSMPYMEDITVLYTWFCKHRPSWCLKIKILGSITLNVSNPHQNKKHFKICVQVGKGNWYKAPLTPPLK